MGYKREAAVRAAFLMAIPAVFGAGILEAVKAIKDVNTDAMFPGWGATIAATVVAFVVGYIVIIGFLKFVSTYSYKAFAIYRIAWPSSWLSCCCAACSRRWRAFRSPVMPDVCCLGYEKTSQFGRSSHIQDSSPMVQERNRFSILIPQECLGLLYQLFGHRRPAESSLAC